MYQVLVYVYENYVGGADTPDRQRLGMRLSSAGFERDEIQQALHWLDGLDNVADGICLTAPNDAAAPLDTGSPIWPAARDSLRVYSLNALRVLYQRYASFYTKEEFDFMVHMIRTIYPPERYAAWLKE